jgi:hypothetical protein
MFTAGELAAMTATVEATLGVDSGLGTSIVLYRGTQTLAAQDARLVRPSAANRNVATDGTEGAQNDAFVVGKPGMDVQARDRFKADGVTYEVTAVQPQRQIKTVAQVRMIQ